MDERTKVVFENNGSWVYRKFFPAVFILSPGGNVFSLCNHREHWLCKVPDKNSKGAGKVAVDGGI